MRRASPYSPHTPSRVRLDDGTERDVPERMTLDEFSAFPWPLNEAWELIWEAPVLAPRPVPSHQLLLLALSKFLDVQVASRPGLITLIEVDVKLPPSLSWVVPDIAVIDTGKMDINNPPLTGAPLLVVEILSPATASADVGPKRDAYAEAGVPEYWTVDPDACSASVHVNPDGGEYKHLRADEEGFMESPLLGCRFRVVRRGHGFEILTG
jgi:Uma2 family endonuclease